MAKHHHKSVPKAFAQPGKGKRDVKMSEQPVQPTPLWRFSAVDLNGPFKWPKGERVELDILQKIHEFDRMTWADIRRGGSHDIAKEKLSPKAIARLQAIKQDDIDALFSFRCSGANRMFGIRVNGVVRLLWWDPDHEVCPAQLKNT